MRILNEKKIPHKASEIVCLASSGFDPEKPYSHIGKFYFQAQTQAEQELLDIVAETGHSRGIALSSPDDGGIG